MNEEKKSREISLKANVEDDEQVFTGGGTSDEVSNSSKNAFDTDDKGFEYSLQEIVQNIWLQSSFDEVEMHGSIIKLLGEFLGIQDYRKNLLSNWILKTLAQHTVNLSKDINISDYKTFIYWLFEEINIIFNNSDMSREEFFELMNNAFHQALSEILNGKDLLLPSELLQPMNAELTEMYSNTTLTGSDSNRLSDIGVNNEVRTDGETSYLEFLEPQITYYENLLHAIIEATYQIFGTELDYTLIQYANNNQKDVIKYTLPYHFRKPRTVKRFEIVRKASTISNFKPEKTKKKKKAIKRNSVEMPDTLESIPVFNADSFRFILPLSEAIESYDVMHYNGNREIRTNFEELN